jgi:hypothetical protein
MAAEKGKLHAATTVAGSAENGAGQEQLAVAVVMRSMHHDGNKDTTALVSCTTASTHVQTAA